MMLMMCTLVLMLEFNITFPSIKIANTIALVMHIWIFNHVAINSFSNGTFSMNMMGLLLVLAFKHFCILFSCCLYVTQSEVFSPEISSRFHLGNNMICKIFFFCMLLKSSFALNQATWWKHSPAFFPAQCITSKADSKKTTNSEHLSCFQLAKILIKNVHFWNSERWVYF